MNNTVSFRIGKRSLWLLLVLYLSLALYLLYFSPFCGRYPRVRQPNLIPFKTILNLIIHPLGPDLFMANLLGNLFLLLPVGWFSAVLFKSVPALGLSLLIGLAGSFVIELLQWIWNVGCFDMDDILLNGLGYFWGYKIGKGWLIPESNIGCM